MAKVLMAMEVATTLNMMSTLVPGRDSMNKATEVDTLALGKDSMGKASEMDTLVLGMDSMDKASNTTDLDGNRTVLVRTGTTEEAGGTMRCPRWSGTT